jgi:uncharacterized protein YkwD
MGLLFLKRAVPLLALICAGCAQTQTAGDNSPPAPAVVQPPPDPQTQMAALEQRIEELIEEERLKINPAAKVLVIDPQLVAIARQRSTDMAQKKYLANAGPDGKTSASILMAEDELFQGLLGENVAAQYYVPASGVDVETFAKRFVNSWLESPRHKENLSFAEYNRTGVGAAVNGDTVYVTQLFSTDLGMGRHDPKTQAARPFVTLPNPQAAKEPLPSDIPKPIILRGPADP